VGYALVLVRRERLNLGAFARETHTHPDLIRRLVALGLLDADRDAAGELWFAPSQVAVMGRVQRLRAGLALNYAAVGLVIDLLDRISDLEAALRSSSQQGGR
jgi:chaperone modulatory protein CbpM